MNPLVPPLIPRAASQTFISMCIISGPFGAKPPQKFSWPLPQLRPNLSASLRRAAEWDE
jgi:hypothetical protein